MKIFRGERGGALIVVTVTALIVFATAAASLGITGYGALATESAVRNINGGALAEGGVFNAERLLNKVFEARFRSVAEAAFDMITDMDFFEACVYSETDGAYHLYGGGETDALYKKTFAELMDECAREFVSAPYVYEYSANDMYDTKYVVTVDIKYFAGGFDVASAAINLTTGVTDKAVGRIELIIGDGAEVADAGGGASVKTLSVGGFGDCRYALASVKKAFE